MHVQSGFFQSWYELEVGLRSLMGRLISLAKRFLILQ